MTEKEGSRPAKGEWSCSAVGEIDGGLVWCYALYDHAGTHVSEDGTRWVYLAELKEHAA